MLELAAGFKTLTPEFQEIIRLAQERLNITITPLQALSGGWSGASIYLVSVHSQGAQGLEHYVLKLDRKNEKARSDEIQRHPSAGSGQELAGSIPPAEGRFFTGMADGRR